MELPPAPVLRGVWVLDRILGTPVPPPPPNVPAVEPDIRATTIREQLAKHRGTGEIAQAVTCGSIPPGFALENYDVIGGPARCYRVVAERKDWGEQPRRAAGEVSRRLSIRRRPCGGSGHVLPDGRRFADLAEFKKLLLAHPNRSPAA